MDRNYSNYLLVWVEPGEQVSYQESGNQVPLDGLVVAPIQGHPAEV